MDHARLTQWLDAYGEAWEQRDPDQVVPLFTEDAVYAESTWAPPAVGHDGIRRYWEGATEPQRDVSFGYEIVTVDPAVARWWASYTRDAAEYELDGVFLLDFDPATGRCSRLREWWFHRSTA